MNSDIFIVSGYLVLSLLIGMFKCGQIKSTKDYAVGPLGFSTAVLFTTFFATYIYINILSTWPVQIKKLSWIGIILCMLYPIKWFIMAFLFSKKHKTLKDKGFFTISEVMGYWFGDFARWTSSIMTVLLGIVVSYLSIFSIGKIFHIFFEISEPTGALISLVIITVYSVLGGIQSVAFTDLFQFIIFFVAFPIVLAHGYNDVGSFKSIFDSLPSIKESLQKISNLNLSGELINLVVPVTGAPYIQRMLMAKDAKQLKTALNLAGVVAIFFLLMMICIILISLNFDSSVDPAFAVYNYINKSLFAPIKGVIIAGLLAIIISTQDSFLNSSSIVLTRDIYSRIFNKITIQKELLIARLSCVFISTAAFFLYLNLKEVHILLNVMGVASAIWTSTITIPLVAGFLSAKISKNSYTLLVIVSLAVSAVCFFIQGTLDMGSLGINCIICALILYLQNQNRKSGPLIKFI